MVEPVGVGYRSRGAPPTGWPANIQRDRYLTEDWTDMNDV